MTTPSATCPICGQDIPTEHGAFMDHGDIKTNVFVCPGSGTPATAGGDESECPCCGGPMKGGECLYCHHVPKIGPYVKSAPSPAAPAGDVRDDATPETDAEARRFPDDGPRAECFWVGFARSLERDRNALRRQHARDAKEIAKLREDVSLLVTVLLPLANIADAWADNGLDESRPEWGDSESTAATRQIVGGRGGKELLTIGHAFCAKAALTAALKREEEGK